MKKFISSTKTIICAFLALSPSLFALQESCNECMTQKDCCIQPTLEIKSGYFFFSKSSMRNVYDKGGIDLQLTSTYPLFDYNETCNSQVYASIEYLYCSGQSLEEKQKTTFKEIPVNFGLKTAFKISPQLKYYFTLGPRYFHVQQNNNSQFVSHKQSRNGIGFFANTGFKIILGRHFLLDIFGEYTYAKTHFPSNEPNVYTRNMQLGGYTIGGGMGYIF